MRVATCSSCGRGIIWTLSPNGARLPLDARPVTVYALREADDGTAPTAVAVEHSTTGLEVDRVAKVYVSHFVTCVNAEQHSKGKRP